MIAQLIPLEILQEPVRRAAVLASMRFQVSRDISCAIKATLQENRRQKVDKVGHRWTNPPLIQEAWIWMQGRHRDAVDRPPPLARVAIGTITEEQVDMYLHVPPSGHPTPVEVQPFLIEDYIPEEEEIAWAVCRLRLGGAQASPEPLRRPVRYEGGTYLPVTN